MGISVWDSGDREIRKSKMESEPQRRRRKSCPRWSGMRPSTSCGACAHTRCIYLERPHWKGDSQEKFCVMFVAITKAIVTCFQVTRISRHRWTLVCLLVVGTYYPYRLLEALWNHDCLLWGFSLQVWEETQWKRGTDFSSKLIPMRWFRSQEQESCLVLMLPTSCGEAFDLSQLSFLFWKVSL